MAEKQQALVMTEVKNMEIKEVDLPAVKADEVVIETAYAGICGTDNALFNGLPGSADAVPPIILGHETLELLNQWVPMFNTLKLAIELPLIQTSTVVSVTTVELVALNYVKTFQQLVLPVMVA